MLNFSTYGILLGKLVALDQMFVLFELLRNFLLMEKNAMILVLATSPTFIFNSGEVPLLYQG
jgi:hypothetical protein